MNSLGLLRGLYSRFLTMKSTVIHLSSFCTVLDLACIGYILHFSCLRFITVWINHRRPGLKLNALLYRGSTCLYFLRSHIAYFLNNPLQLLHLTTLPIRCERHLSFLCKSLMPSCCIDAIANWSLSSLWLIHTLRERLSLWDHPKQHSAQTLNAPK